MRLLYFGDPHIRGTSPRNRTDDYKEALKMKFREIFSLARYNKVRAILCPGDIFDRPEVTNSVLLEFAEVFKESPVPIYTTAGNHDIYGYNLDTYSRTSLRVMELIVPQLQVINDPDKNIHLIDGMTRISLSFQPYNNLIDKDGYGYSPGKPEEDFYKIHIAHGMLLDHDPKVFDRYTYVGTVKTEADLVLCGHDHVGFGIHHRADGKVFMNCGAICRLSASEAEIKRKVQVAIITIEEDQLKDIDLVELKSAKPGEEILDRSKIEAEQKRQYAMEEFATLIKDNDGKHTLVDVNAIVERIAKAENLSPEVVEIALDKIASAKENLRV